MSITLSSLAAARGLAVEQLRRLGWREASGTVRIPWPTMVGRPAWHVRLALGREGGPNSGRRWLWEDFHRETVLPFGADRLAPMRQRSACLVIVESEIDAVVLWAAGLPAIATGGAAGWQGRWWSLLEAGGWSTAVIWIEDTGSLELVRRLASSRPAAPGAPELRVCHALAHGAKDAGRLAARLDGTAGVVLRQIVAAAVPLQTVPESELLAATVERLSARPSSGGTAYAACCPFHQDRSPSLSLFRSDDGGWAFKCHAGGCGVAGPLALLAASLGLVALGAEQRHQQRRQRQTEDAESEPIDPAWAWELPVPLLEHDVPPFPTDTLPRWLREFVEAEATATQTPPDLAGLLVLAVLGCCGQKKCVVRVRNGWIEPLSLYTVVALPPGTRKTAVFQDVTEPLAAWERAESERLASEVAEAQAQRRIAEQRLQVLQGQAAKAKPEEMDELTRQAAALARELATMPLPTLPRLLVDDCTPEALSRLLTEQGGRLGVFSDEGDIFDLMRARYGNAPNFGVFLRAHAGSPIRVDRVGRKPEFVESPALSIGLAVQPDVLCGLIREPSLRGRGLLARFLYAWPAHSLGHRNPEAPPLPEAVRAAYAAGVEHLLRLPGGTAPDGRPAPHVLTLTSDAYRRLIAFMRWLEPQLSETGELASIADWAAKLSGAVVRLAGLLHLAEHCARPAPWERPIELATVEAAITLGQYLLAHARYTFAEMGADGRIADARYLLRRIEETGVAMFRKQEIWQATKGRFREVEPLDGALRLLERHGYLRSLRAGADEHPGPGRRPGPTYAVNPLWLQPHALPVPNSRDFRNFRNAPAEAAAEEAEAVPNSRDFRNFRNEICPSAGPVNPSPRGLRQGDGPDDGPDDDEVMTWTQ